MSERCPICGLRRSAFQLESNSPFDAMGWRTHFISYSNAERLCSGHTGPVQPQQSPQPTSVPQAFYDAFTDDEVWR